MDCLRFMSRFMSRVARPDTVNDGPGTELHLRSRPQLMPRSLVGTPVASARNLADRRRNTSS